MTDDKCIKPYSNNYNLKPYEKSVNTVIFPWLAVVDEIVTEENNVPEFKCDYYTYGNVQHPDNLKLFGNVNLEVIQENSIIKPSTEIVKGTVFIIESHVAQNSNYAGNSFWRYYFFNDKDNITSIDGNTYYKLMLQNKLLQAYQTQETENLVFGIDHVLGINKF